MPTTPMFSGKVSLYDDVEEGLRVECSQQHAQFLRDCLAAAGFNCGPQRTRIAGTASAKNWVEFDLLNGDIQSIEQTVTACLQKAGVTVAAESFSSSGEEHVRLNLGNLSALNK